MPDAATIQSYVDRRLKDYPLSLGPYALKYLTLDEARRRIAYNVMLEDERSRRNQAGGQFNGFTQDDIRDFLGPTAYADYSALTRKAQEGPIHDQIADLAAHPVTGPTSFFVPVGADAKAVMQNLGVDQRGLWISTGTAQTGFNNILVAGTAEAYAAAVTLPDGRLQIPVRATAPGGASGYVSMH